ncbi:transcriptional regulator ATRX-like isoform X2 [Phlebotomus argentipes]|uniref:transcriptional regulator ATRX-like isoform X2 n=1 Tax=Phlebotomus argentipes TaxID=94469 RepID=UPI002892A438|nr:transcriptional regulator ATRX-like isoform X2 [Phlebotomus argentipes]
MSENDFPQFREISDELDSQSLPRVFKREKSVEFNDGTLSGEEDFLGFVDTESDGMVFRQSSTFSALPSLSSSNSATLSCTYEHEMDTVEVASSASDIGSAIFDHDYIPAQDFQENIQQAMRRSDSSDDQVIRQLLYDEDGIQFNVQDIEGRFKLLHNIFSSILSSRCAELADQTSITDFLNKLCDQTESMKQKFSYNEAQIPDNDSGRASKTPPSARESPAPDVIELEKASGIADKALSPLSVETSDIEPSVELASVEEEQQLVATCLDEKSMEEYSEMISKVDALSKIGSDAANSMDELKKTLPLSVDSETLAASSEILKRKIHEIQHELKNLISNLELRGEVGIQTEVLEISGVEVGVQTCEPEQTEEPLEEPDAGNSPETKEEAFSQIQEEADDTAQKVLSDIEPSKEERSVEMPSGVEQQIGESLNKDLDPEGLLVISKVESTEIENERIKRKLLDMDSSSSDEIPSDDDDEDFNIRTLKRRKRSNKKSQEMVEEKVPDIELNEAEEKTPAEEEDFMFDLFNYIFPEESSDEEQKELKDIPKESKPLKEIPEDVETPKKEPESQEMLDEEILENIPAEMIEKVVAEDNEYMENICMEFDDAVMDTQGEIDNTDVTSNEQPTVPAENDVEIKTQKEEEKTGDDYIMSDDSEDSDDDREISTALEPVVNLEMLDKKSLDGDSDDQHDKEIEKLLDFTSLERRRYESTKTGDSKEIDKPRKTEKKKDKLLDILQEVKAGDVSDSSSESSEDELTEEQFLEQCNMNTKHRLLNFSSDESEEELDTSPMNKLHRKKSDDDDDADSMNSDASAIDDFLMNIVQKEIADDVGGEKMNDEGESNKENTRMENELPDVSKSVGVSEEKEVPEKAVEIPMISGTPDNIQMIEDQEVPKKDQENEARKEDMSIDRVAEKSKALKVSSVEKMILSDKIFEGIEVRKDLVKDKISRSLRILSSDDESEKESRSQGEDGANDCLDTSMFHKKDDKKSSEEISRMLAKFQNRTNSSGQSKDTTRGLPSETISLSSDSDVDEVVEEEVEKEAPRRNIRAMLSDDQLEAETKKAQREERDRISRLERRTDSLSQHLSQSQSLSQEETNIVLDYNSKTKQFVSVHPDVVKYLKPHQIDGVKFMYDQVYGDVNLIHQYDGSGCILAHCMGLGKTLQLIALLHTVIRYPELKTNRILVICPKTTIMNWFDEIKKWLEPVRGDISMKVFHFPDNSDIQGKLKILREWHKSGEKGYRTAGCLLIGYEAFRVLVLKQSRKQQSLYTQQETSLIKKQITETLLQPGADLVICDEGHMIKNRKSAINRAVSKIRTKRRIILTGTPIQNNLKEYYCMVDFIKPNFLGTEREFANMYTNPIRSGQHKDSTKQEIKCMKQRSYVLHKKLSKFVQRREAAVLKQFLPEKYEYVLFIPMTEVQERLYEFFLTNNPTKEISGKSLIPDYTALRKIWTHPKVLENAYDNAILAKEKKDRARARLHPESDDEVPDDVLDKQVGAMSVMSDWWRAHLSSEDLESILPSNKLKLIFEILKLCQANGEKCLIFSAFVAVLNVVEYFMRKISNKNENSAKYGLTEYDGPWEHGRDFYRLDGKTPKHLRHLMVNSFNDMNNKRMRCFLISAKAGGQGINLTAANRVIILDTSWNPSNDQQNIFRIYRLGQHRKCFVYRLLAMGTMEEKVYSRSVTKQAMSFRVVDEQQIDRHYNMAELAELYTLTKTDMSQRPTPNMPTDYLLRNLLHNHANLVYKYHEHDSLLENKLEQDLSEADKKEAWDAYENDLKAQRSGVFDQSALNASLLGLNYFGSSGNSNLSSMNYGAGLPGRNYNYNSSMSLLNQLSYQSGMGLNQDPMMLMNQLYQSYPMGMGSSGMQSPYMGYMNQNSYYGGGMYPSTSLSSASNLGQQYKNLQNLAEMAMMPDANLLPRSQSVSPSAASAALGASIGTTQATSTTTMSHLQRNTPSRSMWNLMSTPSYYTPGLATSTVQSSTSNVAKTTPSTSTMISSTAHTAALSGVPSQVRTKTPLPHKSPHVGIHTSVITPTSASAGPPLPLGAFTGGERPTSSSSPQPHVIMKSSSTAVAQKDKESPAVSKVTNMGIVYPTVEQRESLVPSLSSLSPATITKIPTTKAPNTSVVMQKDPKAAPTLSSLLGINTVLQNVTVTPSTKVTKASSTTLTPIVTTTVKSGAKILPGNPPKTPIVASAKKTFTSPAEMVQNLHNVTVKPTSAAAQPAKRQAFVYTAKGKKPIQINQRVVVGNPGNHTSITPITRASTVRATTVSPATIARPVVSQVVSQAKSQGAHLTRISRLVPSTITTPASGVQQLTRVQNVAGNERMIVTKKSSVPHITVVRPANKAVMPIKRVSASGVPVTLPGLTKVSQLTPLKRQATTPISELIANSKSISITQVKKPNLGMTPKPPLVPQSTATLQKITLPVRRSVNKVPPTVLNKDPEIVELD